MVEAGEDLRLPREPGEAIRVSREGVGEDLQRDLQALGVDVLGRLFVLRGPLGGRKGKPGGTPQTRLVSKVPSYAEQGAGKRLANKARKMATLTGAEINAVVSRDKTLAAVTREKTAKARETRLALPDAKYSESGKAGAAGDVVLVGAIVLGA